MEKELAELQRAAQRLQDREEKAREARDVFVAALLAAREAGHSLRECSRFAGVTFGRIHQIERRARADGPREVA